MEIKKSVTVNNKKTNSFIVVDGIVCMDIKGEKFLFDEKYLNDAINFRWVLSNGYAKATIGKNKKVFFHHLIMGKPQKGLVIDHINRNRLDNRKENLRIVTPIVNRRNTTAKNNSGVDVQGIHLLKLKKIPKYKVYFTIEGKSKTIGYCDSLEEAIKIRKHAERLYW